MVTSLPVMSVHGIAWNERRISWAGKSASSCNFRHLTVISTGSSVTTDEAQDRTARKGWGRGYTKLTKHFIVTIHMTV